MVKRQTYLLLYFLFCLIGHAQAAEVCHVDSQETHDTLAKNLNTVACHLDERLYESVKAEFLKSPFCDPWRVLHNPFERLNAVLVGSFMQDLQGLKLEELPPLAAKYSLHETVVSQAKVKLEASNVLEAKALLAQNFLNSPRTKNQFLPLIKEELAKNHIFTRQQSGEIECPFVAKDAFMKALAGRRNVLSRSKEQISNKDLLTIVDYTRPSNERRMFVIDLASKKVLHNTWVAHGRGESSEPGIDNLGSSPEISNVLGSNRSSDGFILAAEKSFGKAYGANVSLKGIDKNNDKLQARGVVLHGWGSPFQKYSTGADDFYGTDKVYNAPQDAVARVRKLNIATASPKEIEESLELLRSATVTGKFMKATEGCLGVPLIKVKHLDRKKRDGTQLELLREDLPGSLIFNYSGPQMESKYF